MTVGVATAMESERTRIEALLEHGERTEAFGRAFFSGTLGANRIVLGETGIGKVNAAVGATALIAGFQPDCLISTGVAGGVDATLRVMDAVASSEIVYHDVDCGPGNAPGQVQGLPPRFAADARLLACAKAVRAEGVRVVAGLVASGDRFVVEPAQVDAIRASFPEALAVDMESGALAQVCHLFGVPFLSFRILSDVPGAEDGAARLAQYEGFWKDVSAHSFALVRAFLEALPARLPPVREETA